MAQKSPKSLGEKFEELAVNIAGLSGEIQTLNKVVGMSRAEQHQFNEHVVKMLDAHEAKIDLIEKEMECAHLKEHIDGHEKRFDTQDKRIRKVEAKQNYIAGVWVTLLALIEGLKYYWSIK